MQMTPTQAQALRAVLRAFLDAVKAAGATGTPGGVLYAAVMGKVTLQQFQQVMDVLVAAGKVRQSGHLYHFVAEI